MTTIRRRIVLLISAAIMAVTLVAGPAASGAFAGIDCHGPGSRDHNKCTGNRDQGQVAVGSKQQHIKDQPPYND